MTTPGIRLGPPVSEAEHFNSCPVCGKAFDMRDLQAVIRHADPEHGGWKYHDEPMSRAAQIAWPVIGVLVLGALAWWMVIRPNLR